MNERTRILYVDDEEDIREVVEFALEDESDLDIALCASGEEALERVARERPDLLLLDVMMPGMDGPEVLARLRATGSDVPVAFMTAKIQTADIAHLMSIGAVSVIAKPFDPMTLASQIRGVLAKLASPALGAGGGSLEQSQRA
jgi:CheY-like chemotaxis protein